MYNNSQSKMEGLDYILLRKHKTSFGNHKNRPHTTPNSTVAKPNCKCFVCTGYEVKNKK